MSKVRIYEVAKELGMEQKALVALFQSMGFGEVRNHMSSVEPELVERVRRHIEKQKSSSIVEERIRPTVVKRRAVGRPEKNDGGPSIPPDVPSVRPSQVSVASVPSVPASSPRPESIAAAPPAVPDSLPSVPPATASAPSVPEHRPSSPRVTPKPPAARPSSVPKPEPVPTDDVGAPAVFSPPEPTPSVPPVPPS